MTIDDPLVLFKGYMDDRRDPVNLPLPAVDDPSAYLDPLEMPGDFLAKLSQRSASPQIEDDLNKSADSSLFVNPLRLEKGTRGYQLRISREETVEEYGYLWRKAYNDKNQLVWCRKVGPAEE
jgi:hypothetical protein